MQKISRYVLREALWLAISFGLTLIMAWFVFRQNLLAGTVDIHFYDTFFVVSSLHLALARNPANGIWSNDKRIHAHFAMTINEQIIAYIESQKQPKQADMQTLHQHMLQLLPNCRLWFLDGKDEKGKVVSNPNIGYGQFTASYKDGSVRDFYQIGISGNTSGISVYIMGLQDKNYLPLNFASTIGRASVTGYCIKFKSLKDINIDILDQAIRYGVEQTNKSRS